MEKGGQGRFFPVCFVQAPNTTHFSPVALLIDDDWKRFDC